MMEFAVRVAGLRVRLGERAVLEEVNLELRPGEMVALLGMSGSGKSVLLRALSGLIRAEAGQIWIAGEPIVGAPRGKVREARRHLGMLFQGNALFDSMTVAENIGFNLREVKGLPAPEIRGRVDELLTRLHLGPIGRMFPSELSGGMKKRVGIARAIAHQPSIVFYDDPTAGLDPVTSEIIADLIAELGGAPGAGQSLRSGLVVSNYWPLITRVADRAAILEHGRIRELGPVSGLSRTCTNGSLEARP